MPRSTPLIAFASLATLLGLGCSTAPVQRIDAGVLVPRANEPVVVDHLVVLVDASASVPKRGEFVTEKALVESFAAAMPDGSYEAGSIAFGGFRRSQDAVAPFDRGRVTTAAENIVHLSEGTPIDRAIREAGRHLEGKAGRAAIVLYTDGLVTDEIGRELDPQNTLDAAAAIGETYDGPICFHTVQIGSDPAGAELLTQLTNSSGCGTFRNITQVQNVASLHQFQREVFLGAAPALPAVGAAPPDLDRDGVNDVDDLCRGTPRGASVDSRGCWVVKGLHFAIDSDRIERPLVARLDNVAKILKMNPGLRVRVDGHTDGDGSAAYNLGLSRRRAKQVSDYLVTAGVESNRLETKGFGEQRPAAANDSATHKRTNRRVEITVIR